MAVRADELTLCYLVQDLLSRSAPEKGAYVAELEISRQVIPLHDLRRVSSSAVRAWSSGLEAEEPRRPPSFPCSRRRPYAPLAHVQVVVEDLSATLADALQTIASPTVAVKLGMRLGLTAARATFHEQR